MSHTSAAGMLHAVQRLTGSMAVVLAVLACAAPASATDIAVTTHADVVANDGDCSLREAVSAANLDAATGDCPAGTAVDRIQLEPGTYLLSRQGASEDANATGDLDVTAGTLFITGRGLATRITTEHADRALDIRAPTVVVRLQSLTVAENTAPDGADGQIENGEAGENGGGIRNAGILSLVDSAVVDNRAGDGGRGHDQEFAYRGGVGGSGGGVYSSGVLGLTRTVVSGNVAGAGGRGGDGVAGGQFGIGGIGGTGGSGGGIASAGTPMLSAAGSLIEDNAAGPGGRGGDGCPGGQGGDGGRGGGIDARAIGLLSSTVTGGRGGHGGGAGTSFCLTFGAGGGAGGAGGGIAVGSGLSEVLSTLLSDNVAGNGGAGAPSGTFGGAGGRGGDGGGLLVEGNASIVHATFLAGAAGNGGPGGPSTENPGQNGASGQGSAAAGTAAARFSSTIFDGSCSGPLTDGGANLKSPDAGCPGTLRNLFLSPTGVPQAGSPAVDGGPATGCNQPDPLGTLRPQGARCDVGAIEVPAQPLSLSHGTLAFDPITVGAGSRFLTLNVANPGVPGHVLPISVTGGPDFALAAESCPDVVLGGTSCDVIVLFAPAQAGTRSGSLRLGDRTVALSGTGVAASQPESQSQPPPTTAAAAACVVPKLKGKTVKAARRALRQANCRLGTVTRRGRGRPGRVRAFSPKAGTSLPAGATVRVVVSRRPRR